MGVIVCLLRVPVTETFRGDVECRATAKLVRFAFRGGEAEVAYTDAGTVVRTDQVLGFDISMRYARAVEEGKTVDEL